VTLACLAKSKPSNSFLGTFGEFARRIEDNSLRSSCIVTAAQLATEIEAFAPDVVAAVLQSLRALIVLVVLSRDG